VGRTVLKRRVDTRLAWLGLLHKDFAEAIGMDKSSFSRVLRADQPRTSTLERIAVGLGMAVATLIDEHDESSLTAPHPLMADYASSNSSSRDKASHLADRLNV